MQTCQAKALACDLRRGASRHARIVISSLWRVQQFFLRVARSVVSNRRYEKVGIMV